MASFALYKTSHPRFMTSNHHFYYITPTVFDIISTVSMSSHPMYWWYHTKWIFEISRAIYDGIISILYDMTATIWHHNHCIHDITFPTYDITSRVYDISSLIPVTSQTLCEYMSTIFKIKHTVLRQYTHYIWNHNLHMCICVITHTVSMI